MHAINPVSQVFCAAEEEVIDKIVDLWINHVTNLDDERKLKGLEATLKNKQKIDDNFLCLKSKH